MTSAAPQYPVQEAPGGAEQAGGDGHQERGEVAAQATDGHGAGLEHGTAGQRAQGHGGRAGLDGPSPGVQLRQEALHKEERERPRQLE